MIPPLDNSDHNGIFIPLKWFWKTSPVKTQKQTFWRYSRADFDKANHLHDVTGWTFLDDGTNIDTLWNKWEERFMANMEESIPKATISPRCNLP